MINDEAWAHRQAARRGVPTGQSGFTVKQWVEAVRAAKRSGRRIFVVMHLFSGPRRPGDIQEWLEELQLEFGCEVLVLSCDLGWGAAWDLGRGAP